MVSIEEYCPECGGKLKTFTLQDPMSITSKLITKTVCTKCKKTIKELVCETTSTTASTTIDMFDVYDTKCPVCGEPLYVNRTTYAKRCSRCGYTEGTLLHSSLFGDLDDDRSNNTLNTDSELPNGAFMGWICPKCGRALSPYTSECPCSIKYEFTRDMTTCADCNPKVDISNYIGYDRNDKMEV